MGAITARQRSRRSLREGAPSLPEGGNGAIAADAAWPTRQALEPLLARAEAVHGRLVEGRTLWGHERLTAPGWGTVVEVPAAGVALTHFGTGQGAGSLWNEEALQVMRSHGPLLFQYIDDLLLWDGRTAWLSSLASGRQGPNQTAPNHGTDRAATNLGFPLPRDPHGWTHPPVPLLPPRTGLATAGWRRDWGWPGIMHDNPSTGNPIIARRPAPWGTGPHRPDWPSDLGGHTERMDRHDLVRAQAYRGRGTPDEARISPAFGTGRVLSIPLPDGRLHEASGRGALARAAWELGVLVPHGTGA